MTKCLLLLLISNYGANAPKIRYFLPTNPVLDSYFSCSNEICPWNTISGSSHLGEGGSEQTDYNHTLAYVHIHLTDKNDNPPKFARNVFYHDFDSMMAKNLMNVTASDPDLGDGGKVKFRMLSSKRVRLIIS